MMSSPSPSSSSPQPSGRAQKVQGLGQRRAPKMQALSLPDACDPATANRTPSPPPSPIITVTPPVSGNPSRRGSSFTINADGEVERLASSPAASPPSPAPASPTPRSPQSRRRLSRRAKLSDAGELAANAGASVEALSREAEVNATRRALSSSPTWDRHLEALALPPTGASGGTSIKRTRSLEHRRRALAPPSLQESESHPKGRRRSVSVSALRRQGRDIVVTET